MEQELPLLLDRFNVVQVDRSADQILRNLFELYCHDMAEWFQFDANSDGRYAYDTQPIWEENVDVYLVYAEQIPVGFALVDTAERVSNDANMRDMEEFFIVRRYRHLGLSQAFAFYLWQQYPGRWIVRVYQKNKPALPFWRAIIGEQTQGKFDERVVEQDNKTWSHFIFTV